MPADATRPEFSAVLEVPAADPAAAHAHFAARNAFETDPTDVHADLGKGVHGFVLVDCRRPEAFAAEHVPGAINVPWRTIAAGAVRIPEGKVVVTYCSSGACNASTKGAARFAALGYQVKEMVGGLWGWKLAGYPTETSRR